MRNAFTLMALGCTVALASCGGSPGTPTVTNNTQSPSTHSAFLHFSICMRLHGVPNFPDPQPGGGINLPSGLNPQSPVFQAAQEACKHLLPGGGPPAHVPESVKQGLVEHARCVRAHGVPSFPDPTFPKGGGIGQMLPPGLNPSSPALQRAMKACASE